MTVSMVHEVLGGWTISLPSSRTGGQLYNDYATELSQLSSHIDQWPADQTKAYRMLSVTSWRRYMACSRLAKHEQRRFAMSEAVQAAAGHQNRNPGPFNQDRGSFIAIVLPRLPVQIFLRYRTWSDEILQEVYGLAGDRRRYNARSIFFMHGKSIGSLPVGRPASRRSEWGSERLGWTTCEPPPSCAF